MKLLFSAVFLVFALSGADGQAAGEGCGGASTDTCDTDLVCDTDTTCKIDIGGDCTSNTDNCKTGTTCDNDACKIDVGEDCTSNADKCKTDTACDNNVCRVSNGQTCTDDTTCVSGAKCTTSDSSTTCQCDTAISTDSGSTCTAKEGFVYGACKPGNLCDDSNAECMSDVCQCKTGHTVNIETLTCSSAAGVAVSVLLLLLSVLASCLV